MRWMLCATCLLACLALPASASTPNTGPKPWDPPDESPVEVTRSVKLAIEEVDADASRLVLVDDDDQAYEIVLDETVEIKARRKKDFDGRKDLRFRDLEAGQKIKLTYRTDDRRIVSILVLEPAPQPA